MKTLSFIRDIARKFPILLAINTILVAASSLAGMASVLILAPIVDILINPNMDMQSAGVISQKAATLMAFFNFPVTLGSLLAIFLLLNILTSGFQILAMRSILRTKYVVIRDLMLGTFNDFFQARWHFFSSGQQGKLDYEPPKYTNLINV